ncbi:MAG: PIN domain-containing protein [Actinomycetota bacterium]|nr:PIN domain-containing protein [Actinomycetota bacterium]
MLCVDVNVLVDAFRQGAPSHVEVSGWLHGALAGQVQVAILPVVGSGFIRIVTNRRAFPDPTPLPEAMAFVDALLAAPRALLVPPGPAHWPLFTGLVRDLHLTGDDVPDAFIAAAALDLGAILVSSDRGFRRFPGLRVVEPVAT